MLQVVLFLEMKHGFPVSFSSAFSWFLMYLFEMQRQFMITTPKMAFIHIVVIRIKYALRWKDLDQDEICSFAISVQLKTANIQLSIQLSIEHSVNAELCKQ